MGTAVQDLSKHYQDVVKAYLKFGRHRTDLHLKEVQTQLDSIVNSRYGFHSVIAVERIED